MQCILDWLQCIAVRVFIYGKVALLSEMCPKCRTESFVIDRKLVCCGRPATRPVKGWKRMSPTPGEKRKKLTEARKRKIIGIQNGICIYCDLSFRSPVYRNSKRIKKSITFDHFVPWSYSQNDDPRNVVAACSICNEIKSWFTFRDLDECRDYIAQQRRNKGYTTERPFHIVSEVRDCFRTKTKVAKVLF